MGGRLAFDNGVHAFRMGRAGHNGQGCLFYIGLVREDLRSGLKQLSCDHNVEDGTGFDSVPTLPLRPHTAFRAALMLMLSMAGAFGFLFAFRPGLFDCSGQSGAPIATQIGVPGSRGLQRSPDGLCVAWLEPSRGEPSVSDLVEYRADTRGTRRIGNVLQFSYGPTGELAVIQQGHGRSGERLLGIVGRAGSPPKPVGSADEWWLGPGGSGASQSAGSVVVWSGDYRPKPVPLRAPIEVIPTQRPGQVRLVLREKTAADGRVVAMYADGRLVTLARGATSVSVATGGNAVAVAGCDGAAEEVCVWRGDRFRRVRVRAADVVRLEFDYGGAHLAILSGAAGGTLFVSVDGKHVEVLDRGVRKFAWSTKAPLLLWRSGEKHPPASGVTVWTPSGGVVALSCGYVPNRVESAIPSPDGRSVACLEISEARGGSLWLGSSDGRGEFREVSYNVIEYGFSPMGDALWVRDTCAHDRLGCTLAVVSVGSGTASGALTKLAGLGGRLRFDENRSARVLFESNVLGGGLVVRDGDYSEELGKGLRWSEVALLSGGGVVYVREGPTGGVFLMERVPPT